MLNDKIRFAVLGCGHIGQRHAGMIAANPQVELAALIEPDPSTRKLVTAAYPGVPVFTALKEFIDSDVRADVVNIATPNMMHAGQAIECMDHGFNVVIEKPMALSRASCEAIIHNAGINEKHVFCVMQNRYSPPSEWLKETVSDGRLGDIYMVQINCYWNRDERYYTKHGWHGKKDLDGGTLFTQFSHFIDLMYWVFGDITDIKASFSDFNHNDLTDFEDSGLVSFRFINGGMGSLNYSTSVWDKNLESSMTVIGEYGTVKVGGQYMDKVEYCHIKDYIMPELKPTNPPNEYGPYKGSAANHHYIIENVVSVLKGQSNITTNALEGLKVVDIIERIYALKQSHKG
jgi:UDP-N-acetyl-2-amino-2-deoxyglucuronate dehydrogenase